MNISQLINLSIISVGSLFGANLRYIFLTKFHSIRLNKRSRLLLINSIASIILGLALSLNDESNSRMYGELIILFLIGFSASLSTFSSFINDLFKLSIKKQYKDVSIIIFLSISLGLLSISLGLMLGSF